jgi:hypothetical protein
MIETLKLGETCIVAAPLEFQDADTDWTVQEGEKVTVKNIRGEETEFYVQRLPVLPNMLLLGKDSLELYPTKKLEERVQLVGGFEKHDMVHALEPILAAIEQREFKKGNLRLKVGEVLDVFDPSGKHSAQLKVWKVVAGILMLTDPNSRANELSLLDRLRMALDVFNGKFFAK